MSKGLFDGVSLLEQENDFIDLSEFDEGGTKPPVEEKIKDEEKSSKSKKDFNTDDEGLIVIPDEHEPLDDIDDEEKDKDNEDLDAIEVEDKETEETGKKTPPEDKKGSSSSSAYKPFAKALTEVGFLPEFTDEEYEALVEETGDEAEALMELSRRSYESELDAWKNEQNEDFKAFIEAKENGVDLNKWYDINQNKKTYSSITEDKLETDEGLQKKVVAAYLQEKGFSKEEIDDTIETYEDTAKLEGKAKSFLKNLVKIEGEKETKLVEQRKQEDAAREQQRAETLKTLKNKIEDYKEIVPGIQINKQTKERLYKAITEPSQVGPNGEQWNLPTAKRMEDPIKYAIIEAYLIEQGVFDGKFDKIMSKTKSKALADLKSKLSDSKNTAFKSGKSTASEDAYDNFSLPNL